jgi:phenylalanyl-tRNA synthetase alpha chain
MSADADLQTVETELLAEIDASGDLKALDAVRIAALGKKGRVSALMSTLGKMPAEERKAFGQSVNALKDRISAALATKKDALAAAELEARLTNERDDVTLPVRPGAAMLGRIHPVSQVFDEIIEIFGDMGFAVAEGPHIETDWYNFGALNIPEDHPARQEHDTFYFNPREDGSRMVLRTHTSPVQIRTMEKSTTPIRIIAPGRTFRCDRTRRTRRCSTRSRGWCWTKTTHLGHLKWCLEEFCKAFFEVDEVKMRFRASHFPFTEPSMEVDINYSVENGQVKIGTVRNGWRFSVPAWCTRR